MVPFCHKIKLLKMTLDWAQFYCLLDKSQISSNCRLGLESMFEVLWHSWHGSWHWDVITLNLWHVTCDNCVPSNCPMSSLPSQPWLHLLISFPTQHHHPDHHCQLTMSPSSQLPSDSTRMRQERCMSCPRALRCVFTTDNWQQRGKLFYIPRIKFVIIEM